MQTSTDVPVKLRDSLVGKRLAFFDCDGVLLDSNRIKLAAVEHALRQLPEPVRERCLASFKMNFGRPRLWHFEAFYRLAEPAGITPENFARERIADYEAYLQEHYLHSPTVTGAHALLAGLIRAGTTCYVISGGKESEIKAVLQHSALSHYFAQIVGSPTAKTQAITRFLAQHACPAQHSVFFGDALADAEAALACKVPFLFVSEHALVDREALLAQWPAGSWGGEVFNLAPDNGIVAFDKDASISRRKVNEAV